MVMQSVMEEKTNRIVELMVSSVKPFQLMMGKIVGIAFVGFLQLAIWGIMLAVILTATGMIFGLTNFKHVGYGYASSSCYECHAQ